MVSDLQITEKPSRTFTVNPRKFILWLFIVSIIMLFGAFSSAYMVKKASGDWLAVSMPGIFYINSIVIILSSISAQFGLISARKNNIQSLKISLIVTTILGFLFLAGQFVGWKDLVREDVFFVGHPSGSFIYVFTGLHGAHLVSGLIFLILMLVATYRFKVHSKSLDWIQMCTTYWHFLGALWLYLFIFLLLNN